MDRVRGLCARDITNRCSGQVNAQSCLNRVLRSYRANLKDLAKQAFGPGKATLLATTGSQTYEGCGNPWQGLKIC